MNNVFIFCYLEVVDLTVYQRFLANEKIRRLTVLLFVVFVLFLVRSMITTILLTFIFTYLMIHLVQIIQRFVRIPTGVLAIMIYTLIIYLIYLAFTKYIPMLIHQTFDMIQSVIDFYEHQPKDADPVLQYIHTYIERNDFFEQLQNGASIALGYLQDIGKMAVAFAMSFILSFFFMIEKKKTIVFSRLFLKSEFSWFFQDIYYFADKFVNTFGLVLEAQFVIALLNTLLTTIALAVFGFHQLLSLAIMIFILSLIPVAGVIISCIPLSFIAYSQGGIRDVVYILITILIVHLIESYVLNPKLMSSKTELPIFYTFVVLLVSERFFGVWGLIVGIPIFTFFLDVLKVKKIPNHLPKETDIP
ncbi:AI-2E family transporter [Enterococcus faecium]|uniref:AI-2E family transporter n=1 Tax=Enterococcus faecium TaxID=1352 RepID=UPI000DEB57E9|nr:AI-2E family transporter [Enterococcus faecium]